MRYLIAYISINDGVLADEIIADNQPEAIRTFKRHHPCCEILAITILEEGR